MFNKSNQQQKTNKAEGVSLKLLPLGGMGMVTKNMFVYEFKQDIVIVDCGIGFPESEQLGVDVIIPDVTYLRDKLDRIRGIVITHGHEDHFGGLPYVLEDLGRPPIYTSKLVNGFTQVKLEERGLLAGTSLHQFRAGESFSLGVFTFTPFHTNHSVPDSYGFFIETPVGNFVHAADYKFDWTPVDGQLADVSLISRLSEKGVTCLLSDCLGAEREGYTQSERSIQDTFEKTISQAQGQVFITTVSSNISRIQQAVNAAIKFGRKVSFLGLSVARNVEVARGLGFIDIPRGVVVEPKKIGGLPDDKLVLIVAGSYAQPGSSLSRIASDGYRWVKLKKGAVVVFSADPIPGVYDQVGALIDRLVEKGAEVSYSDIQENLHVSGHGSQGDLSLMAGLVHPKYFMPIGGSPRHMRAYSELMGEMSFDRNRVLELRNGEGLEVESNGNIQVKKMVNLNNVFVDGSRVGDIGEVVLKDRQILADDGIFVVIVQKKGDKLSEKVEVVSRGFVYMASSDSLVKEAKSLVGRAVQGQNVSQWGQIRSKVEKDLSSFLYSKTERKPMILSILVG